MSAKYAAGEKMKVKRGRKEQRGVPAKGSRGQGVWRIVAITVIVVFAVFMLAGLIKARNIRSSFVKPTQPQADYAAKIATDKLRSSGANPSAFHLKVGEMMRKPRNDRINRAIVQVLFCNETTTHMYLVDASSGEVILHSQTDVYKEPDSPPKLYRNGKAGYAWVPCQR